MVAAVALGGLAVGSWRLVDQEPSTIIDDAFEVFGLEALSDCDGFDEQFEVFREVRGDLPALTPGDHSTLEDHWARFLQSSRGAAPQSCEWTIQSYPVGFIATGPEVMIALNPSDVVLGASLPKTATGDFVMDQTRYSDRSLGAFRGAATIPPRSLAVISLR